MGISRTYTFTDTIKLKPTQVEVEISNITDYLNNILSGKISFSGLRMSAPDGKTFLITIIYDTDGVTPLLQIAPTS